MSEEKKPDGWIGWHPTKGFADVEIHRTIPAAIERLCMEHGFYEDGDYQAGRIDPDEAHAAGWRIRPVKLVFLDEEL